VSKEEGQKWGGRGAQAGRDLGGVVREAVFAERKHGVVNNGVGVRLEPINPVVPNTVRELLLLPEQNLLGQEDLAVFVLRVGGCGRACVGGGTGGIRVAQEALGWAGWCNGVHVWAVEVSTAGEEEDRRRVGFRGVWCRAIVVVVV